MPRQSRKKSSTGIYHVMLKGINKQDIFEKGYCQAESYVYNSSQDEFTFCYYDRDHLGNIRQVTEADGSSVGSVIQTMNYYPFGAPHADPNIIIAPSLQPYKYNGKELDLMHGLNTYDYGARQYLSILGRWDRIDPLCEKYYSLSPYNYCGNNPIVRIDPNGMSACPIYDLDGDFLGTDDEGLKGDPIVMNKKDFHQGLAHHEAFQKRIEPSEMGNDAYDKMMAHCLSLPFRPDYDGYLTLEEANDWYVNGNGEPLFTDLDKIDLSGLRSLGESFVGQEKVVNLLEVSNNLDDGLVYGNIKLKRYPNHTVRAYADKYDFDMKSWFNPLNWVRNIETIIGKKVAGEGIPYNINIYGSKKLKPIIPWIK